MPPKSRNYEGVLNPTVCESLRELQIPGEPDIYENLKKFFLESSEQLFHELQDPASTAKRKDLAHSWKSSAAGIGAEGLSELCASLERDPERTELIKEIGAEYSRVRQALREG